MLRHLCDNFYAIKLSDLIGSVVDQKDIKDQKMDINSDIIVMKHNEEYYVNGNKLVKIITNNNLTIKDYVTYPGNILADNDDELKIINDYQDSDNDLIRGQYVSMLIFHDILYSILPSYSSTVSNLMYNEFFVKILSEHNNVTPIN